MVGKARFILASLHIIEENDTVNVAGCSHRATSRICKSLQKFLVGGKVTTFPSKRVRHVITDFHSAKRELSCQYLRTISVEIDFPCLGLLGLSLAKQAGSRLLLQAEYAKSVINGARSDPSAIWTHLDIDGADSESILHGVLGSV